MARSLPERFAHRFAVWRRRVRFAVKRALRRPVEILAVINWRLGDEIMTIPLYRSIKEAYPRSRLTVRCNFPDLLEGNPYVDAVNDETRHFDWVLDLKEDTPDQLRIVSLARRFRLPVPADPPRIYLRDDELNPPPFGLQVSPFAFRSSPFVAVSAGAGWACKQWSLDKFRALCRRLQAEWDATVLELGRGCASLGVGVNLIDKTSAREAACVLRRCDLFIGNDSGLTHLALAVGTPTVGLFGPVNPDTRIAPQPRFAPVWSAVECRGCWSRRVMQTPGQCPIGTPICMGAIEVGAVFAAAERLLAARLKNEEPMRHPA